MRLDALDHGHGFGSKLLFGIIRLASGHPVSPVIKVLRYHADFFGKQLQVVTQEAMRGRSEWSVGDRELMAAVVSKANDCTFCVAVHTGVAAKVYDDAAKVDAAMADHTSVAEPLRSVLLLLQKLGREHSVDAADMRRVLKAGATRAQIRDALAVAYAFGIMNRLANAFDFAIPGPGAVAAGAKYLAARGYG